MHEFKCFYPEVNIKYNYPNFSWNKAWLWPYESAWGIFEKFKLANAAQDKDILGLMGSVNVRNKVKKFYTNQDRNLIHLNNFDSDILSSILGTNIKELILKNNNAIISILPRFDKDDIYFKKNVCFCPDCIEYGYHSIFHQVNFIQSCPFHSTILINECPDCKRQISYILSDKYTSSPFVCQCGHSYINIKLFKDYIRSWTMVPELKITTEKIQNWIDLSKSYKGMFNNSFFLKNIAKSHFNDLIDYFTSLTSEFNLKKYPFDKITHQNALKSILPFSRSLILRSFKITLIRRIFASLNQ
jgi:hypothetical protein